MSNATPMRSDRRQAQYVWQNNGAVMTQRQRRRWRHKQSRQLVAARKQADSGTTSEGADRA